MCLGDRDQDGRNWNASLLAVKNCLDSKGVKTQFSGKHFVSEFCFARFWMVLDSDLMPHDVDCNAL